MIKLSTFRKLQRGVLTLLLPAFSLVTVPVYSNPAGASVVAGGIDINNVAAGHLHVTQSTQLAIIDWQSFSIAAGETTRFIQPNASSAVLNRVVTGNPTAIYGSLQANGNVIVINPNGIVVGAGGVIDVGGMVALSTLDMSNEDFLNGGASTFYGGSSNGVSNFGTISSAQGDVIVLGGFVDNQGQIGALNGTVALGAGGGFVVQQSGGSTITVQSASDYTGTGVNNSGTITSGAAELKAHGNVFALAINNGGAIRANGSSRVNGRVRLTSSGSSSNIMNTGSVSAVKQNGDGGNIEINAGPAGAVNIAGDVSASATANGLQGGVIEIAGRTVTQEMSSTIDSSGRSVAGTVRIDGVESTSIDGTVRVDSSNGNAGDVLVTADDVTIGSNARINADGFGRGGRIRVGGELMGRDLPGFREANNTTVESGAVLSSDSTFGDAGSVVVWANNDTVFRGDVSASARGSLYGNGGLVEVSGLQSLTYDGNAEAISVSQKSGTVLFDPGTITVGNFGLTPGVNEINISTINNMLQGGTSVVLMTQDGSIIFDYILGGADRVTGSAGNGPTGWLADWNSAIQWTNSAASFGAFASENIFVNTSIRTSGGGSINLMAGWGGQEADLGTLFLGAFSDGAQGDTLGNGLFPSVNTPSIVDVESIFDYYVNNELFGGNSGLLTVGSSSMTTNVQVGSRFGNTNLAARTVFVTGSDVESGAMRFAQVGFNDSGNVFAPRLNNGGGITLDMTDGSGNWILSDGTNSAGQAVNGVDDPVVGIAGRFEADPNGDGIMDGVYGVNSTGVLDGQGGREEVFIPYSNNFNSASTGNWWWQQLEDAGNTGLQYGGNSGVKDASGLGGLRPEWGAGGRNGIGTIDTTKRADINVIATGSVVVEAGDGRDNGFAMIGHGGSNTSWYTRSRRSNSVVNGQLEARWTINGAVGDRSATSISRLAPVYGNINVLAGVDIASDVSIDRVAGTVTATVDNTAGDVIVRAGQDYETGGVAHNSPAQIGHGGIGQFGQFFGDIRVEAGGIVDVLAGTGTRSYAAIGHTFAGFAYFNAPDNVDQQIRFFATYSDQRNPNLRRGELFSVRGSTTGTTGFNPANDPAAAYRLTYASPTTPGAGAAELTYTGDQGSIRLAPLGVVTIEALDGSVANGLHGDVSVIANGGDVTITAGSTPADPTAQARDRRFARVGHGGVSFTQWVDGAGYDNSADNGAGGLNGSTTMSREIVRLTVTDTTSGSRSISGTGTTPGGTSRSLTFMTLTGDILIDASGDVSVTAGNDVWDYAQIGHGGTELADTQTSSFALGDILINAGGDFTMTAGGSVSFEASRYRNNSSTGVDIPAYAQVGHGGIRTGIMNFTGDIEMNIGGDFTTRAGAYYWNYVQIGHGGVYNFSQAGGNYSRTETYILSNVSSDITIDLDETGAVVTYAVTTDPVFGAAPQIGVGLPATLSFSTAGDLVTSPGSAINTANIDINVGGDVFLGHLGQGIQQNANQAAADAAYTGSTPREYSVRTELAWNLIGHGGFGEDALREGNPNYNFGDKIGNVSVIAGGDVTMENGNGTGRWTRIGHGLNINEGNSANLVSAVELIGDITVAALGNVMVNARAASANGDPLNAPGLTGFAIPSTDNPVAIGHGGIRDNRDVVVLGAGEDVNGIIASSDITVTAGGNMEILGGLGRLASFAQVGHGYGGDGNDRSLRNGLPTGFTGDITVSVAGDLLVEGGPDSLIPSPITTNQFSQVRGAFAAIGNGGYQIDAPAFGDINVYVGNNLAVTAQQRTQLPGEGDGQTAPAAIPITGLANFAKIGHVGFENTGEGLGAITDSNMGGDIVVVVGNDMTMTGGSFGPPGPSGGFGSPVIDARVAGAFAQVGHGGPGISGELDGAITVLVGNNLTTIDGSRDAVDVTDGSNNYAMIGNGDWLRNGATFSSIATGARGGDISVLVGETARFDQTLIGHADPNVGSTSIISGNTQIAVSRNNPFFGGGTGRLIAENGTVFSSANYGSSSLMSFYMPGRSSNLLDGTTRINEATATLLIGDGSLGAAADADFADAANGDAFDETRNNGLFAGRSDEVYLTPDLWWDDAGVGAANGFLGGGVFPTDASSGQGGSIAIVNDPGGLFNIDSLVAGSLGFSGNANYRGANGVSGAGQYTFFFDAISVSSLVFTPPPIFFDFGPFYFEDKFDSFDRLAGAGEIQGVSGVYLYDSLGAFEGDEETQEEAGASWAERALDNQFGPRRDPNSEDERDEADENRVRRGLLGVGPLGMTYYVFDPSTNQYSSLRLFGVSSDSFYPTSTP